VFIFGNYFDSISDCKPPLYFYDYAHFSHTFKKITGVTPKAFQLHPKVLYPNFLPPHQQTLEDNETPLI